MPKFRRPMNFVLRVQEYLRVLDEIDYNTILLPSPLPSTKCFLLLLSCSSALSSTPGSKEQVRKPRLLGHVRIKIVLLLVMVDQHPAMVNYKRYTTFFENVSENYNIAKNSLDQRRQTAVRTTFPLRAFVNS